jgi:GABA permease
MATTSAFPADVPPAAASPGARLVDRLLVVANETLAGDDLRDSVQALVAPAASVLVVCPVIVTRLRYWTSDLTCGMVAAQERLRRSLATLRGFGLDAEGTVADADPVLAIADALRVFQAQHVLVSTHPYGRSTWLERRVVERARRRFLLPVSHVVIDL